MRVTEHSVADRRARRRFLRVPFDLHGDDPRWVPPMLVEQRAALHPRRNPFFAHSDASLLLAERDGKTVGRLLVMEHRPYNQATGSDAALFDLIAFDDDPATARALIEAAAAWGRRRGLTRLSGPRRMLAGTATGILVDGFEHPPSLGGAWNPEWYDPLLTGAGMTRELDLLSGYVDRTLEVPAAARQAAAALIAEHGLTRHAHRTLWAMWRDRLTLVRLYNEAFADTPGFCPLTEAEIRLLARGLVLAADPEIAFTVRQGDEITAFMVLLPDVTAGIRRARGRVLPFGWWHILRDKRRTTLAGIHLFGVMPPWRGTGMNVVAYAFLASRAEVSRYRTAEAILIEETNSRMVRNLDLLGGITWAKRHRVYRMDL